MVEAGHRGKVEVTVNFNVHVLRHGFSGACGCLRPPLLLPSLFPLSVRESRSLV
jgi:hypothetical protein